MATFERRICSSFEPETERLDFEWNIIGFNKIPFTSSARRSFKSPLFTISDKSDVNWQMIIMKEYRIKKKPRPSDPKKEPTKEKAIGFLLTKLYAGDHWETVRYQVTLQFDGKEYKTRKNKSVESSYHYLGYTYLFESDLGDEFFNQDELIIKADLELILVDKNPIMSPADPNRLNKDLMALFESKDKADVILKAEDSEILAHKSLLGAKAYKLDRHFQDGPAYLIPKAKVDFDANILNALLVWVYCCGLPKDFPLERFPELVKVAKRFEMSEFVEHARKYLEDNLGELICPKCLKATKTESVSEVFLRLPQLRIERLVTGERCRHSKG